MNLTEIVKAEGNEKHFEYKGFDCLILRTRPATLGHLCGYVQIPKGHKLYDLSYNEIEEKYNYDVPAHGGLTFDGELQDQQGHWIGFDCAHSGDISPMSTMYFDYRGTYKDMAYVENSIKEIVDFIKEREHSERLR